MALATRPLLTTRSHDVFAIAYDLADRHGHDEVTPVHLALAMFQEGLNFPAQLLLYRYKLPHERLRNALEGYLPPTGVAKPLGQAHSWSAGDERILELAAMEARELKTEYFGCEHIFLSFLRDTTTAPSKVLAHDGIHYDGFRGDVLRIYNGMDWAEPAS